MPGHVEAGVGLSGDPQEHLHGGALLDLGRRGAGLRDVERGHRDRLLRAPTQGHPAGHEQSQGGQLVEEARDGLGALGAGVDVVEHHERALVGLDVRVELAHEGLHGRDHVVGRLALGDEVEVDVAAGAVAPPGRRDRRRPGLAAAAEPDQRDQTGVRVVEAAHDGVDELVAAERGRPRHGQARRFAGHRLVRELGVAAPRVVLEDRGLDALERLAGLDAELVGQDGARLGVHLEGLLAAVLDVQGRHQLRPQPFAGRVLGGGGAQLLDRLRVAAQPEQLLEALLERADPGLPEPLDRLARERHVLDPGEDGSAPHRQGSVQRLEGRLRRLLAGAGDQPLELDGVDVRGLDVQAETCVRALEGRPRAVGPDPVDQRLQRRPRGHQPTPEPGGDRLERDRVARGQRQQRDQGALPLAAGGPDGAVDDDLDGTQQPNQHGAQRRAAGAG